MQELKSVEEMQHAFMDGATLLVEVGTSQGQLRLTQKSEWRVDFELKDCAYVQELDEPYDRFVWEASDIILRAGLKWDGCHDIDMPDNDSYHGCSFHDLQILPLGLCLGMALASLTLKELRGTGPVGEDEKEWVWEGSHYFSPMWRIIKDQGIRVYA